VWWPISNPSITRSFFPLVRFQLSYGSTRF
jgi:hypothetical protein